MLLRLQIIILEMIARGEPLRPTMDRLCLEVEVIVPGTVCSVLTVDASRRIHPLSAPNLPDAYCAGFAGALIGPDMGACGTAAFRAEPVSAPDLRSDPLWARVDVSHLPAELVACWSSPILDARQRVIGTFAFYFRENRGPTAIEKEVVAACAQLCAIAIERDAQKIEHDRLAFTDTLTGLANRAGFNKAMTALQRENPGAWGLLLIDLDNLKKVNDTFGHPCGDRLLAGAAESIASVVPRERAFRIGGDELAVLVPLQAGRASLIEVAGKILEALKMPVDYLGHAIVRSATVGGALLADDSVDIESVKRNADLALYHAKEMGRGRFALYEPGLGTSITRRLGAVRLLSEALQDGRIEPFYQPIIDLGSGEIVGLEALCRITARSGAIVAAAEFHEATADVLVASELTQRMIAKVAQHLRAWRDLRLPLCRVGINVAASDIRDGKLADHFIRAFGEAGVPLSLAGIEITESVCFIDRDEAVSQHIGTLRRLGISVALDDFGTGQASLTDLLTVPVDVIKIDQSFVERMRPRNASFTIIKGLIGIANDLGIHVVAEGVETSLQAAQLRRMRCPLAQGFHFARPADHHEMTRILQRPRLLMPDLASVQQDSREESDGASDDPREAPPPGL
jgi:diguanylate cyclase (GGDEF)-like protein